MLPSHPTHYIPYFTEYLEVDGVLCEEAACGEFVTAHDCTPRGTEPTCPGCRTYCGLPQLAPEPVS